MVEAIIMLKFNKGVMGAYEFELSLLALSFFVLNNSSSGLLDTSLMNRKTKQKQSLYICVSD